MSDGGYVYFVRNPATNDIKIGYSENPASRLISLQTAHAERLHILATIPGDMSLERWLHVVFAHHRLNGEWFRCHPEILAFIAREIHDVWRLPRTAPPMPQRAQEPPPKLSPEERAEVARQARSTLEDLQKLKAERR